MIRARRLYAGASKAWSGFLALITGIILALPLVPGPWNSADPPRLGSPERPFRLGKAKVATHSSGIDGSGLIVAVTESKGSFHMTAFAVGQTFVISERFDKAVRLIRDALAEVELSVVGEFDTIWAFEEEPGKKAKQRRILLVDCPWLVFEAQALDRAAGVLLPLHVLVWADGDRTQVSTVSLCEIFDVRLPLGAAGPMERLQARVTMALESVVFRTGPNHYEGRGAE